MASRPTRVLNGEMSKKSDDEKRADDLERLGLARTIKDMRERLGWSQAELAKFAKTSQQTVDRIERGETLHSRAFPALLEVLRTYTNPGTPAPSLKISEPDEHPSTTSFGPLWESFVPTERLIMPSFEVFDGGILKFKGYSAPSGDLKGSYTYQLMVMTADFAPDVGRLDVIFVQAATPPRVGDLVVAFKRFNAAIEHLHEDAIPGQKIFFFRITEWKIYKKTARDLSGKKQIIDLVGWEIQRVRGQLKFLGD